jgi:hypothetical protein
VEADHLQSALVVASGNTPSHATAIEIFTPDTSQWYKADALPTVYCDTLLVAIGNTCGGFNGSSLNHAFYASIDDLLGNAVPANQTTCSNLICSSKTKSVNILSVRIKLMKEAQKY